MNNNKEISIQERKHIKLQIEKKCNNCANMSCRVEQYEKPVSDCIGWENNRLVEEYKILKLKRINNKK